MYATIPKSDLKGETNSDGMYHKTNKLKEVYCPLCSLLCLLVGRFTGRHVHMADCSASLLWRPPGPTSFQLTAVLTLKFWLHSPGVSYTTHGQTIATWTFLSKISFFLPMFDAAFLFTVKLYHVLWRKDWEFTPEDEKTGLLLYLFTFY